MAAQWSNQVSEADARSLSQKLAEFSKSLTPNERVALTQVIHHTMSRRSDMQGYAAWDPTQSQTWWNWWKESWEETSS